MAVSILTVEQYEQMKSKCFSLGERTSSDDDSSREESFYLKGDYTEEQVKEFASVRFPITRCQHEFDCCGGWYRHSAPVIETVDKNLYKISDTMLQNV